MKTRTLLILAAVSGLLILLAGGVKLLQVANDPAEVAALALGQGTTIGDMTASVTSIQRVDDATLVAVRLSGVPGADPEKGWRLWGDGSTTPLVPVVDDRATCAGSEVPDVGDLQCTLVFPAVQTVQGVIYLRAGEQRQWAPAR